MQRARQIWTITAPLLLCLMALGFVGHAMGRGLLIFDAFERATSRLIHSDLLSDGAIYGHMFLGGALTLLAPLQLIPQIRRRLPRLHHVIGYIMAPLALLTSLGGLIYIALQGTIGGPLMSAGFALYGLLMATSAVQTVRMARGRDPRHQIWALRLVILALASWIYRVHYGIWYALTDGAASNPEFTGLFDQVQTFAFYLPYLILLEIWWRRRPRGQSAP